MIKIELTEREKRLLEIGYLRNLSYRRVRKNKFTLKKLVNDTTTSETDLITWRNSLGLEKVKNRYESCHGKYELKCKYIASPDFPMADELFIRESLLINPIQMVHTSYNAIGDSVWKKIKTIVNLIEMYNMHFSNTAQLVKWLVDDDHYDSVKMMLGTLNAGMAISYASCERLVLKNGVAGIKELNKNLKYIRDLVDEVYDYSEIIDAQARYEISCLMKISVCPYCNRQYITILNGTKKGTATFDHYYREATYPIFKLSLYNLVPSCYACNSVLKGKDDREHLNPWYMEKEEVVFDIKLLKDEKHYLKNFYAGYGNQAYVDAELLVQNANSGDKKTENSMDVFKLQDTYRIHTQDAAQFAAKAQKYERGKYKESLINKLKVAGFAVDEEMVDQMMYGFSSKVIGTKDESKYAMSMPLYKLKRDLIKKSKGI